MKKDKNGFWEKIGSTKDYKIKIGDKEYTLGYATKEEYDVEGFFVENEYGKILLELRICAYDYTQTNEKNEIPEVILSKLKSMGLTLGRNVTRIVESEEEVFEEI